ncbi:endonuclease/exonuclease/phosphatase family protein [Streptomyces sp. MJP52]|uniref:endonuclease/exonuclease/phosphatase family protein n=1 Tax=Streptomyces sp. MJP52 TaxID=2940555 RepID=UPI00247703F1|nr:endonuclease/exonuclease/phosphatase family protein [Streptomyces sp. MJP52]MDH6228271.1 endonuclease/exonuclease/phosphatase family metal-dependent hydrolase [Streptomyces sp. MJP52]
MGALAAACMLLIGPAVPGGDLVARPLPADAARGVVPNRVMTWNLCNPCGAGNADRAREIATYAPQVVGLQEACVGDVERIRDHLRRHYGLAYHVAYGPVLHHRGRCGGAPWNPGGYGQAVLSAAPITDRVSAEYPDGGSEDRGYLAVTTTVDGRTVRVFTTHLAQRRQEAVRAEQAAVLAAEIARHDRAVVLGDFNAVPGAPELAPMWAVASDADARCRPSSVVGCAPTTDWLSRFDYVFLRGVTAIGRRVLPTPHSDHDLLYADLELSR